MCLSLLDPRCHLLILLLLLLGHEDGGVVCLVGLHMLRKFLLKDCARLRVLRAHLLQLDLDLIDLEGEHLDLLS